MQDRTYVRLLVGHFDFSRKAVTMEGKRSVLKTVDDIRDSIAYCGLVCAFCSYAEPAKCQGCRSNQRSEYCMTCSIRQCCLMKKLDGCWECDELPCSEDLFKKTRTRAFVRCMREDGLQTVAEYLKRNADNGMVYHRSARPLGGDYDDSETEDEVLSLLRTGHK